MLRAADRENLEITRFIFHPILVEVAEDHYFDNVVLTPAQREFFKKWFADALRQGTEFEFINRDEVGGLYEACIIARDGTEDDFAEASKRMTASFKRFHGGNTSNGILAIAVATAPSGHLLFLVKTTFEEVKSYVERVVAGRRQAQVTDIPNPISGDHEAVQKVAIVNIDSDYPWDVLAQDRQNSIPYKIADFFKNYLNVRDREVASELTKKAFTTVKQWVRNNRDLLDPDQRQSDYWGRAYDYLSTHNEFESDQFIASVVFDGDEERRERLRDSLRQSMTNEELVGRAFQPRPNSIPKIDAKVTMKTGTGVVISFTGSKEANHIQVAREGNEQVITIRTPEIQYR